MKICIVTPAPPHSRQGNRVTATRWARLLRQLGHQVVIRQEYDARQYDVLVALHAWKSFPVVAQFLSKFPQLPLIVTLTGTDAYRDFALHPQTAQALAWATRLVVLQPLALQTLPESMQAKAHVIYQSVLPPQRLPAKTQRTFDVCVVGHLREVKDPFRAAWAAHLLPASSRIRILHAGKALSSEMETQARQAMQDHPRYHWLGELAPWRAKQLLARSQIMVLSSLMEGGAHVISEAAVVGTPVLASAIDGSIGLLGPAYPGYFPVQDTEALAQLLHRVETDVAFLKQLTLRVKALAPVFEPQRERESWRHLLTEITACRG